MIEVLQFVGALCAFNILTDLFRQEEERCSLSHSLELRQNS
jgi:hypothetical protein